MPLYDYGCKNEDCKFVFESLHKIADTGPSECPACGCKDVKKFISVVHGKVELTGNELKAQIKADALKLTQDSRKSTNTLANLVGENKFHENQLLQDKIKKEFD